MNGYTADEIDQARAIGAASTAERCEYRMTFPGGARDECRLPSYHLGPHRGRSLNSAGVGHAMAADAVPVYDAVLAHLDAVDGYLEALKIPRHDAEDDHELNAAELRDDVLRHQIDAAIATVGRMRAIVLGGVTDGTE